MGIVQSTFSIIPCVGRYKSTDLGAEELLRTMLTSNLSTGNLPRYFLIKDVWPDVLLYSYTNGMYQNHRAENNMLNSRKLKKKKDQTNQRGNQAGD